MKKEINMTSATQTEKKKCNLLYIRHISILLLMAITSLTPSCIYAQNTINGHEYVDLGLPSGLLWATYNVGANSPEGYGDYFIWGMTKVNPDVNTYDLVINSTVPENIADISGNINYDVAAAKWGGSWRMPTTEEAKEMINNCKWEVLRTGNEGYIFQGTGPNGNHIYFPLAGIYIYGKNKERIFIEEQGLYHVSNNYDIESYEEKKYCAFKFYIDKESDEAYTAYNSNTAIRLSGFSVRAVSSKGGSTIKKGTKQTVRSQSNIVNGHEYVDLGLSVKWATCNVGATRPEQYGNFFAWGETAPKSSYTKNNSKTHAVKVGNIGGREEYDAARALWGKSWRMPTSEESQELIDKCTWKEIYVQGVKGVNVTGPSGKSIFLPYANIQAGDYRDGGIGDEASYSISTEYDGRNTDANRLNCFNEHSMISRTERYYGLPIRPVLSSSIEPSDVTVPISYKDEIKRPISGNAPQGNIAGHPYVDLGLSVKWATCNVGANSPEEEGDHYAWGETSTKRSYKEKNSLTYRKDITDFAGNPNYDVATAKWGGTWKMPTLDECKELATKCIWIKTEVNGKNGFKVIGPNKNSIFIPYTGMYMDKKYFGAYSCQFWSSTPYTKILDSWHHEAFYMDYSNSYFGTKNISRFYGMPVRPVSK